MHDPYDLQRFVDAQAPDELIYLASGIQHAGQ
jgi:uncharacterized protein (DUF1810 family)